MGREDTAAANGSAALSVQTEAAKYFTLQNRNNLCNGNSSLDFSKSHLFYMYGEPWVQAYNWHSWTPPRLILKLLSHAVVRYALIGNRVKTLCAAGNSVYPYIRQGGPT